MSEPERLTLVLRFADVGVATYASLRVIGQPSKTVTWVVEEPILLAALEKLGQALPDPAAGETRRAAVERALSAGPFTSQSGELELAYVLGVLLIGAPGWQLLLDCVTDPRAVLFVAPSARLASVPWGLLAVPTAGPSREQLVRARRAAATPTGPTAARIPWQPEDLTKNTEGYRLMELVDVLLAAPPNIVNSPRTPNTWNNRRQQPPLVVLDPRVPGQRPDSELGSVLGRPTEDSPLVRYFEQLRRHRAVLPEVAATTDLFRRTDADRSWLAGELAAMPSRLLFVGHASAADGDLGHADRAALHLACTTEMPGYADSVGQHRPLSAADLMAMRLPIPPRVALLACASGGDYRFDEATGLVAAMILGGAQCVTATLWSLPTTAGYRQFSPHDPAGDPMSQVIMAVDRAHEADAAGLAVNRWQREQMRRWRDGDVCASPVYWAAVATFTVDGAR